MRLRGRGRPSRPPEPPRETPTPLSLARVGDALTRRGDTFRVDESGYLTGTWNGHRMWLIVRDEHHILQVRGRWSKPFQGQLSLETLQTVNDINRDQIVPKLFIRQRSNGLAVYGEMSTDFSAGATDGQLDGTINMGLTAIVRLFEAIQSTPSDEAGDEPPDEPES